MKDNRSIETCSYGWPLTGSWIWLPHWLWRTTTKQSARGPGTFHSSEALHVSKPRDPPWVLQVLIIPTVYHNGNKMGLEKTTNKKAEYYYRGEARDSDDPSANQAIMVSCWTYVGESANQRIQSFFNDVKESARSHRDKVTYIYRNELNDAGGACWGYPSARPSRKLASVALRATEKNKLV